MTDLPQPARQVLAELELCMHGKTAAWNPSGTSRGENPNPLPQGESSPPHLVWRSRFLAASPDALAALVANAREELIAIRGYGRANIPPPQEETREQWEARMLKDGEGFEARDVAVSFRCAVADVIRIRLGAGRDPNHGGVLKRVEAPLEARRERVLQMRRGGASTRQIAQMVGVHQTQVVRWTREAA